MEGVDSSPPPAPEPKPATTSDSDAQADARAYSVPDMFMRGGTRTSAHDLWEASLTYDEERRRAQDDFDRKAASIPVEQGGAMLYESPLTGSPDVDKAYVMLDLLTSRGEQAYDQHGKPTKMLCDITVVNHDTMELALIVVCPRCKQNGRPMSRCELTIRQSNRMWHLDTRTEGELIIVEDVDYYTGEKVVENYRSAGKVMDSERFSCGDCGWAAHIDKNRIWPE